MKRPEDYNITDLIPQRPPMLLIDGLTFAGDNMAGGRLFVKESNVFCHDGLLQEAGLIEFIGQTAAAHQGYLRLSDHKEVSRGFLTHIKNFVIKSLPAMDTEIFSEITIEHELPEYSIITGRILQNNSVIAEGELWTLLVPPGPAGE
jgi:predicted hotdog family 3-hydroxylacyl-ACP dehydratase